jgi:inositol-phosphate transport system substrate-binding protein
MKRLFVLMLIGCFVVSGGLIALGQDTETITITVRCRAKPPMEDWRGNNFILAAEGLNADLEAAGDPRRVEVVINQDNIDWGDYVTEFVLSYGAGEDPDIWLTGHEYIGVQAEAGRIIALDELMKEFPGFKNVIDNLWDSTSYKGEIWGVPQDAEARPLYFNKALLGELGWTANEIAALPDKIEKGEFTLYDMLAVAKEAVDKGVVADGNGFWTRPKNGPDFTAFYYAFGGDTIDAAVGKLVFDEAAGLKYYQFFYDAAQTYGSMGCLGLGWGDAWHPGVSGSKVLFWIGGTWQWAEWAEAYLKDLGGEDYMWETFGFALIPAAEQGGQANSLTHPLAYLISSQCEHPDLALALIDKVTDYGPNTRHAIASTHLGILKGQTEYKFYKDSRLLSEALYMLAYTGSDGGRHFHPPGGGGIRGG